MSSLSKQRYFQGGVLLRKYLSYSFESLFFPPPRIEWRKTAWGAANGEGELCGVNDEGGAGHQELTDHNQPEDFCSKL